MAKEKSRRIFLDDASDSYVEPDPNKLRIVPLGGVGEFGKNMMTLEYGEDMVVVDCGQMFPDHDMLGVDTVIPDFGYIAERSEKLRGVILTHGHEDHIGAIAHFLRDFDTPVYGSRLTLEIVRSKLKDATTLAEPRLHEIQGGTLIRLGEFRVEFLRVAHSMPDSMALAISLPIGKIIHTGDYKLDPSDPDESQGDSSLARTVESGLLMLLADSTNVDREGTSPSEQSVLDGLRPILESAEATVIVSTLASCLHRIQTVLTLAEELGRKVSIVGFGLERNFEIGTRLGLLDYPEDLMLPLHMARNLDPRERLLVMSGCQGEPQSSLFRMSLGTLRGYRIQPGDTVILSARMIPGNERAIYRMTNHLYRRGARVITDRDAPVHASGHAYSAEMLRLYRSLRPQYFIPVHGELRQLIRNGELAASIPMDKDKVLIIENGDTLDLDANGVEHRRAGLAGQVLLDGKVFDPLEEVVLRDRKNLSEDGMIIVILVIDKRTLEITAGPDIVSRGFVEVDTNEDLMEECKEVVVRAFEACEKEGKEEWDLVKTSVRKALRKFLRAETDRFPVILPVIIEL